MGIDSLVFTAHLAFQRCWVTEPGSGRLRALGQIPVAAFRFEGLNEWVQRRRARSRRGTEAVEVQYYRPQILPDWVAQRELLAALLRGAPSSLRAQALQLLLGNLDELPSFQASVRLYAVVICNLEALGQWPDERRVVLTPWTARPDLYLRREQAEAEVKKLRPPRLRDRLWRYSLNGRNRPYPAGCVPPAAFCVAYRLYVTGDDLLKLLANRVFAAADSQHERMRLWEQLLGKL
jgi:hypothetical protein